MPTMHYTHIDHVSLDVADRAHSLAWYGEVLGLTAAGPAESGEVPVFLGPAGRRLAFFEGRRPGLRHVALSTTRQEQARIVARLDRLGIVYQPERHRFSDSVYLADPDGATLELMVPR